MKILLHIFLAFFLFSCSNDEGTSSNIEEPKLIKLNSEIKDLADSNINLDSSNYFSKNEYIDSSIINVEDEIFDLDSNKKVYNYSHLNQLTNCPINLGNSQEIETREFIISYYNTIVKKDYGNNENIFEIFLKMNDETYISFFLIKNNKNLKNYLIEKIKVETTLRPDDSYWLSSEEKIRLFRDIFGDEHYMEVGCGGANIVREFYFNKNQQLSVIEDSHIDICDIPSSTPGVYLTTNLFFDNYKIKFYQESYGKSKKELHASIEEYLTNEFSNNFQSMISKNNFQSIKKIYPYKIINLLEHHLNNSNTD